MNFQQSDEVLDDLWRGDLRILQKQRGFKYGIDAVLLAHFAKLKPGQQALDIGTGSGIIPLLLAQKFPQAHIHGIEIQPEYADMAQRSVALNRLENVSIREGDARQLSDIYGRARFNVVLSNPPYHDQALQAQDRAKAIARSEVYLSLHELIHQAAQVLKPRGSFYLIYHPRRMSELMHELQRQHLELKQLRLVHPAKDREATMVMLHAVKNGGRECRVLPPLFVYAGQDYTPEIYAIYNAVHIEKERR